MITELDFVEVVTLAQTDENLCFSLSFERGYDIDDEEAIAAVTLGDNFVIDFQTRTIFVHCGYHDALMSWIYIHHKKDGRVYENEYSDVYINSGMGIFRSSVGGFNVECGNVEKVREYMSEHHPKMYRAVSRHLRKL